MKNRYLMGLATLFTGVLPLFAIFSGVYVTSFESPTFVPGVLAGQDGWFAGVSANAFRVSTELPRTGAQSVRIDGSLLNAIEGFSVGAYGRAVNYDPIANATPLVQLSGNMNLSADAPTSCGAGIGLSAIINESDFTNVVIGVRVEEGTPAAFLSNADGVSASGPAYTRGQWANVRAVFDFRSKTVRGFFNETFFGEVPFTQGAGDLITAPVIFLSSSVPIPDTIAYIDDFSVTTTPLEPVPTVSEWGLIASGLLLLIGATIVLGFRRPALAGAGGTAFAIIPQRPLFDAPLFARCLGAALSLLAVILALVVWSVGSVSATDVTGSLITALGLAYLVHLWLLLRKE